MRISDLSQETRVPIAVLKLYIREGLLPRGQVTSATQAVYGQEHVDRVRLIQALRRVQEMPLAKVRMIVDVIDSHTKDIVTATGRAIAALPPYPDAPPEAADLADAREVIEGLGMPFLPDFPATVQLQTALDSLTAAGLPADVDTLRRYSGPLSNVAAAELAAMRARGDAAVEFAVLGTVLYEPVILAIRRLLHHYLLSQPDA